MDFTLDWVLSRAVVIKLPTDQSGNFLAVGFRTGTRVSVADANDAALIYKFLLVHGFPECKESGNIPS